jgi:hypothetical protein
MVNESGQNERSTWKFCYKGEDLLPSARRRLAEHQAVEAQLRDKLARMVKDPASFHTEHQAVEAQLRDKLAQAVKDPTSFHDDTRLQQLRQDVDRHNALRKQLDDTRLQQLKQDVDRHSALREQLEVYCHEFARTPKKEFSLRLSDVVFFGIHSGGFISSEAEPDNT